MDLSLQLTSQGSRLHERLSSGSFFRRDDGDVLAANVALPKLTTSIAVVQMCGASVRIQR